MCKINEYKTFELTFFSDFSIHFALNGHHTNAHRINNNFTYITAHFQDIATFNFLLHCILYVITFSQNFIIFILNTPFIVGQELMDDFNP